MTTNNHPANGPVSLERLHQIRETLSKASAQSDGGNLGYAMADAVKVIDSAIAAFGAETVAVNDDMAYAFHHALSDSSLGADEVEEIKTGLRAAFANVATQQTAPVISPYRDGINAAAKWVDQQRESYDNEYGKRDDDTGSFEFGNDAQREYSDTLAEIAEGIRALHPNAGMPPAPAVTEWTNEECLEFLSIAFRHAEIKGDLELDDIRLGVKMVNDGRDTMLQADNSPATPDGYVLVPIEPTMAMLDEFDSIIDYGAEDSKDAWSRLIASAPQQQNAPQNIPEIIPGWIPVSERMPERDVDVQVYCADKKEQMVGCMERNETEGWFRFASLPNGCGVYCKPTHWMPLSAEPQQEVKRG